jgi:flavin-binding protein dodecin
VQNTCGLSTSAKDDSKSKAFGKTQENCKNKKYINIETEVYSMMEESVYPFIELVGSSPTSWEEAAENAIKAVCKSLWCLRIAKVKELDTKLDDQGRIVAYRAKLRVSFKYDDWKSELGWKGCRDSSR